MFLKFAYKAALLVFIYLAFAPSIILADNGQAGTAKVKFKKQKDTVYSFLQQITDQSGYMFIYDSELIDNSKVVKLTEKENTLHEAIREIVQNEDIKINIINSHIILQYNNNTIKEDINLSASPKETAYSTLHGHIFDAQTQEPIPYCSVSIHQTSIGTITNNEGEFRITLADSILNKDLVFSHIGYKTQEVEASHCIDKHFNFYLQPHITNLTETVVSIADPYEVMEQMKKNRTQNYSLSPVYITAFYREGIDYKNRHVDVTEGILKIYKSDIERKHGSDQAELLKMRRIKNNVMNDSLRTIVKIQSGISTCFDLDIMRDFSSFLNPYAESQPYNYKYAGVTQIDNEKIYIIAFEQKENFNTPLFTGLLYINANNYALEQAKFEVNPKYIRNATDMFIIQKNKNINFEIKKADYTISYKKMENELYYTNYIRVDLEFNLKNKKWFFNFNTPINVWLEFTNCLIDTTNVERFSKDRRILTDKIFSETAYKYDYDFWKNFNIVVPEKELKELIIKNINQIVPEENL